MPIHGIYGSMLTNANRRMSSPSPTKPNPASSSVPTPGVVVNVVTVAVPPRDTGTPAVLVTIIVSVLPVARHRVTAAVSGR